MQIFGVDWTVVLLAEFETVAIQYCDHWTACAGRVNLLVMLEIMCAGSGEQLLLVEFCLCFEWSLVSCLNLALTNFLGRFLLALYANLGVVLVNLFRIGISAMMAIQCLWTILNVLLCIGAVSGDKCRFGGCI